MRNRHVLVADLAALFVCALGAFVLRLDWFFTRSPEYTAAFRFFVVAALVVKPPIFFVFGLYRRYWQYASVRELLLVLVATIGAGATIAVVVALGIQFNALPFFPRSILAIDWLLTMIAIGGIRVSPRLVGESVRGASRPPPNAKRVLIVGAGDAGSLVVREMRKNPHLEMMPVAFLDDEPAKAGTKIHGVRVLGPLSRLEAVVEEEQVEEVIVAMPKAPGAVVRTVLDACHRVDVTARALPGMFELIDGGVSVDRLRQLDIADLLRRRPIEMDPHAGLYLQGKVVLVTGAGGSIGSELCRQVVRARAAEVVLLGHGENSIFEVDQKLRALPNAPRLVPVIADVRDETRLREIFLRYRPDVVFHAAAHKHVPLMEAHPVEAVTNNVLGTRAAVRAALASGVERFVLISTDKAVAPHSIMGATKRVAELIVQKAAQARTGAFLAVRFGNVLGSRGSVVPFFKKQIEAGGPITVTHPDVRRFFMTIPEAVFLVLKAGGLASGGELFVLNMGEPVRIADLAKDLVRLSGLEADEVPIVYSGLRPGEKLDEQLWEPEYHVEPVNGGDVLRLCEPDVAVAAAVLEAALGELEDAASRGDGLSIHRVLSDLLPTFVSAWHDDRAADTASVGHR
jgi:FlaA1/EpsC-like NDP-sugar epimerase